MPRAYVSRRWGEAAVWTEVEVSLAFLNGEADRHGDAVDCESVEVGGRKDFLEVRGDAKGGGL